MLISLWGTSAFHIRYFSGHGWVTFHSRFFSERAKGAAINIHRGYYLISTADICGPGLNICCNLG